MLKKINDRENKSEQMKAFVAEAYRMVNAYGWQDMIIAPYGRAYKLIKAIKDISDYDRCTRGSKEILILLANGLANVLNAWESRELEPKVKMNIRGIVKDIPQSDVEIYLELGAKLA